VRTHKKVIGRKKREKVYQEELETSRKKTRRTKITTVKKAVKSSENVALQRQEGLKEGRTYDN